jgi:hypothetical protein
VCFVAHGGGGNGRTELVKLAAYFLHSWEYGVWLAVRRVGSTIYFSV